MSFWISITALVVTGAVPTVFVISLSINVTITVTIVITNCNM